MNPASVLWKVVVQVFLEPCIYIYNHQGRLPQHLQTYQTNWELQKLTKSLMMEVGKDKNEGIMWIALIYVAQQRPQKEVAGVAKRPNDLPRNDFFRGEWLDPKGWGIPGSCEGLSGIPVMLSREIYVGSFLSRVH